MLLSYNTDKVIEPLINFDNLKSIDKVRLAVYLMDNLEFKPSFNIRDINILLKQILAILDPKYTKTLTNFANYKNLLFLSSKYLELSLEEKRRFSVEMLFNIYVNDFKNEIINQLKENLQVFDYSYTILDK